MQRKQQWSHKSLALILGSTKSTWQNKRSKICEWPNSCSRNTFNRLIDNLNKRISKDSLNRTLRGVEPAEIRLRNNDSFKHTSQLIREIIQLSFKIPSDIEGNNSKRRNVDRISSKTSTWQMKVTIYKDKDKKRQRRGNQSSQGRIEAKVKVSLRVSSDVAHLKSRAFQRVAMPKNQNISLKSCLNKTCRNKSRKKLVKRSNLSKTQKTLERSRFDLKKENTNLKPKQNQIQTRWTFSISIFSI